MNECQRKMITGRFITKNWKYTCLLCPSLFMRWTHQSNILPKWHALFWMLWKQRSIRLELALKELILYKRERQPWRQKLKYMCCVLWQTYNCDQMVSPRLSVWLIWIRFLPDYRSLTSIFTLTFTLKQKQKQKIYVYIPFTAILKNRSISHSLASFTIQEYLYQGLGSCPVGMQSTIKSQGSCLTVLSRSHLGCPDPMLEYLFSRFGSAPNSCFMLMCPLGSSRW